MVASLLLILVAVVLLVLGLAGGSSIFLIISIAASLLAAVALVAGARQAVADRAAADPGGSGWRSGRAYRPGAPAFAGRPPAEPELPVQHVPSTVDPDGTGRRQPPEPSVTDGEVPSSAPGADASTAPGADASSAPGAVPSTAHGADPVALYDEPPAQEVTPIEAARVARLYAEVWVIDGRPRYHLAGCGHLTARRPEPVPVAEAVDLGFTPCARCAPDTALLADAGRA